MAMYPLCVSVRALLVKYIGFRLVVGMLLGPWYWHLFAVQFPSGDYSRLEQVLLLILFSAL